LVAFDPAFGAQPAIAGVRSRHADRHGADRVLRPSLA